MGNWNRALKGINVGRLLFDGHRRLVVDKASVGLSLDLQTKQDLVETPVDGADDSLSGPAALTGRMSISRALSLYLRPSISTTERSGLCSRTRLSNSLIGKGGNSCFILLPCSRTCRKEC
jgi:hypothetical protein